VPQFVACFKALLYALLSPINGDKERAIEKSASEEVCAVSATLRVVSRFERNTECKSETLGFGVVLGLS